MEDVRRFQIGLPLDTEIRRQLDSLLALLTLQLNELDAGLTTGERWIIAERRLRLARMVSQRRRDQKAP